MAWARAEGTGAAMADGWTRDEGTGVGAERGAVATIGGSDMAGE